MAYNVLAQMLVFHKVMESALIDGHVSARSARRVTSNNPKAASAESFHSASNPTFDRDREFGP